MACVLVWVCTRVHLLLCFLVSMNVCFSRVWCFGPAMIASGYECVLAEPWREAGPIAVGSSSSYRLPSSQTSQSSSSQAPPRGLLRSFALPEGPATRSSACFVQQTSLGGPFCLHRYPLGFSLLLCQAGGGGRRPPLAVGSGPQIICSIRQCSESKTHPY